jgi:lipoprotein NlpI
MITRIITILLLLIWVAGCSAPPVKPPQDITLPQQSSQGEDIVSNSSHSDRITGAIISLATDPELFAENVTPSTLEYFENVKELALRGKEDELYAASPLARLMVAITRENIQAEQLMAMDLDEYLIFLRTDNNLHDFWLNLGQQLLIVNSAPVEASYLVELKIPGFHIPVYIELIQDGQQRWLVDLTPALAVSTAWAGAFVEHSGVWDEEDAHWFKTGVLSAKQTVPLYQTRQVQRDLWMYFKRLQDSYSYWHGYSHELLQAQQIKEKSLLHFKRGEIYAGLGLHQLSLSSFSASAELTPDFIPAYQAAALESAYLGLAEQSDVLINKAIDLDASDTQTLRTLAIIRIYQRQFEKAKSLLEQYLAQKPESPYMVIWLYLCHWELGEQKPELLSGYLDQYRSGFWNEWIMDWLLDEVNEKALYSFAYDNEQRAFRENFSEAHFYLGYRAKLEQRLDTAKHFFELTVARDIPYFIEYHIAEMLLKQMEEE